MQCRTILDLSFLASGAVTTARCVGFSGAQANTQGQKVAGVARFNAVSGDMFPATASGTAIVEAGAAVSIGQSLICDNQGRAIPATGSLTVKTGAVAVTSSAANGATILSGADLPEYVFGDALEAASVAGDKIEVLLRR
ncbi:MAG: capsid cement protein [Rhodospirillaceae bacterium]